MADRINCYLLRCGVKKLSGAKINDWLVEKGYLEWVMNEKGKFIKLPTRPGAEIDIVAEERVIREVDCVINTYGRAAQQLIVDNLDDILSSQSNKLTNS